MRLTEWLTDIGSAVAYYPKLGKIFGVKETVLLCQFIWWQNKYSTEDGSFFKSREEIFEATGLSLNEQDGACKRLKKFGILETFYHRLSHTKFYFLHFDKINELWEHYQAQTPAKPPYVKNGFGETEKTALAKSHFPTSRNCKIPLREVGKCDFDNKRLKKETNKDKTTKIEICRALTLLGFSPTDQKTFVCLLNLHNKYSDPELWESNIEYTANQKPENPIAYLTQSLKLDFGRALRGQKETHYDQISLPPPGAEIIYNDEIFLVEDGHVVRNRQGRIVLMPGLLHQGLKSGAIKILPAESARVK